MSRGARASRPAPLAGTMRPLAVGTKAAARVAPINDCREMHMLNPKMLEDLSTRFSELIAASPARDLEKNAKAMASSMFSRLDLVTREEFDVQKDVLARTRVQLEELEARVAELEARLAAREG
jgi:ubiquinone biosynthesis accessory factor UbiK